MSRALDAYAELVANVDRFASATLDRRREVMKCRQGCSGCCRVSLSVSPVEAAAMRAHLQALDAPAKDRIRRRAEHHEVLAGDRCAFLDDEGRCDVYAARPLVCRSQGLPLAYPNGVIAPEAVMARGGSERELTWCPLNFETEPPHPADVLDAHQVDAALALINQSHCTDTAEPPLKRTLVRRLAADVS